MSWTRHVLGPKALPQKCSRCGTVLIEERYVTHHGGENDGDKVLVADPLEAGGQLYHNAEEGAIATTIPATTPFQDCVKP